MLRIGIRRYSMKAMINRRGMLLMIRCAMENYKKRQWNTDRRRILTAVRGENHNGKLLQDR